MDIISYLIGLFKGRDQGKKVVVFEGDGYTFTDPNNDGHVYISKEDDDDE